MKLILPDLRTSGGRRQVSAFTKDVFKNHLEVFALQPFATLFLITPK